MGHLDFTFIRTLSGWHQPRRLLLLLVLPSFYISSVALGLTSKICVCLSLCGVTTSCFLFRGANTTSQTQFSPVCWPRGTTVAGGKHSCDSEHPSVVHASFQQTAWAVLCCVPVLIFDWCSEFQVPHFHAAIGFKHRQVAPWKCKDSLDFCPPYSQRAQSYKCVCSLCSSMYHLGFSTLQPAPF